MRASLTILTARAAAAAVIFCAALVLIALGLSRAAPSSGLVFSQFAQPAGRTVVYLDPFTGAALERAAAIHEQPDTAITPETEARSPDGTRTVWPQITEHGVDLFVEDAAGALVRLTQREAFSAAEAAPAMRSNTFPIWSPDGQWISFISTDPQARMDLYLVRADGTALRRIYADVQTPMPLGLRWLGLPGQPFQPWLALAAFGVLVAAVFGIARLAKGRQAG